VGSVDQRRPRGAPTAGGGGGEGEGSPRWRGEAHGGELTVEGDRRLKMRRGAVVVRPLARMRSQGERDGARVVCSERRKERKGESGVVAGCFNRRGSGERERGGPVWDVPCGGRSQRARVGGVPWCTTGAAGWLLGGPR
jgi:hypothetical protein